MSTPKPYLKYKDELIATAKKITTSGKGILAADESTGTIGQRFSNISVENTETNRRDWRELLFTTEGLNQYISGVIMYTETTTQTGKDGTAIMDILKKQDIVAGIKVDKGLDEIPGTTEKYTKGMDTLDAFCKEHYERGCRFAKWRAVLKIDKDCPSDAAIEENAHGLARYAAVCQANGLVPIVEPEILQDGDHTIEKCAEVSEKVISACMAKLLKFGVLLEGILLKPNMVTPGVDCKEKADAAKVAWMTVRTLSRSLLPACPGVMFLSGGSGEIDATNFLNEINKVEISKPWVLSFSYGRALQGSVLKAWVGKEENKKAAQDRLMFLSKNNSEACLGKWVNTTGETSESMYVRNYVY